MHWRELNASDRLDLAKKIMASLAVDRDSGSLTASGGKVDEVPPFMLAHSGTSDGAGLDDGRLAEVAKQEMDWRDARLQFFSSDLWGELGWAILLDLFIQRVRGKGVTVTSACIASRGAPTTALRWVKYLEDENLILAENCSIDARRRWLHLSPDGLARIRRYLLARANSAHGQPKPKLHDSSIQKRRAGAAL